mmetsp:Transcript_1016/g.1724  ORF Transcript_1016/g.1724 Transcript_1016/m.1724 type:complete len:275 (+) Transcript_1016:696-1520(+)
MGLTTSSSSFRRESYSSFSALWFSSSQASAESMASLRATLSLSDSLACISLSSTELRKLNMYDSQALRASTLSANCLSCSRFSSSSLTMRSISSSDSRPFSALIVMSALFPLLRSFADTCRMPLASTLNVTSICGTPRGNGGMPLRSNFPRMLLSLVKRRSPSYTWMLTPGWLSEKVENVCDLRTGMVVPREMSEVMRPPAVSMPSESGVTSRSSKSFVSSDAAPERTPPCTAAPYATASSGLIPLFGSLPPKNSVRSCCTLGIRVEPPTSTTS